MNKVVLALALFGSASATLYTPAVASQKYLFQQFVAEHGKAYGSPAEEAHRFAVFVANLKLADERNAAETGSATHGITKFMDETPEEFRMSHLNYVPVQRNVTVDDSIAPLPEGVAALKDWSGVFTTPVKDQGYCGSCWAFSATEQIETDFMRSGGPETILSAQQVSTCTTYKLPGAGGCNGGFTENAYDYAKGGVETDANYPYTSGKAGVTGTCQANSKLFVVKATSYATVSSSASGESAMASYVQSKGPLSVCVDANNWSTYTGGVLATCGNSVDHCVQAVGIDTSAGYWKVRNSWGTSWGESGYIRLKYGSNQCQIASDATYSTTAAM
jgi:C1A family cysteine protease